MTLLAQRHLFGPGPSNCYPEATAALGHPLLGHLDPDFIAMLDPNANGDSVALVLAALEDSLHR